MKRLFKIDKKIWHFYAFTFLVNIRLFTAILVPFFTQWGGISYLQVSLLQSWFMFWFFIFEGPTGIFADYFGRKYALAFGALTITIAAIIFGSFHTLNMFFVAEFLYSLAASLISGADKALLYDLLKKYRQTSKSRMIFGRANVYTLLGLLISAPIGSMMASKFGLNTPLLFSAIPFAIASFLIMLIKEPMLYRKQAERKSPLAIARVGFTYLFKDTQLLYLVIDGVLIASAAYFVIWLYPLLLDAADVPVFYYGYVFALLIASQIVVSSNFASLTKLLGSDKRFLNFSTLMIVLAFILVSLMPNLLTILIFVAVGGGFGLTRIEFIIAYMNKYLPSAQRATILSVVSMLRRLVLVIFNPLVGLSTNYSLTRSLFFISLIPLAILMFSPLRRVVFDEIDARSTRVDSRKRAQ